MTLRRCLVKYCAADGGEGRRVGRTVGNTADRTGGERRVIRCLGVAAGDDDRQVGANGAQLGCQCVALAVGQADIDDGGIDAPVGKAQPLVITPLLAKNW